jgi:poly-gamma-glutamate capsule biosynthesis protein CapA/YwtB (metallophosphatase superfamily)
MLALDLAFIGDIILDVPDPDHWFAGIADITRAADVTIGHLEVPHTRRGTELVGDVPAPGADPDHLAALVRAGIDAVSMAGNHIADCGAAGIADTNAELDRLGIAHTGADATLTMAGAPAWIEREGRRIALLSYNCVGPEIAWATADRAGSAYVAVRAADGGPSRPQADLVEIDPVSLAGMAADISAIRGAGTLVVVALHKGITHRPAELAPYERPLAHAAIDAGADIVVGHHAHIVRGIEIYRGRPIYHGLGNGVVVTNALSPGQDHVARAEWVERRKRMFNFEPDPAYTLAPFHPEAVNGMIGHVRWHVDGRLDAGFIPTFAEPPGRPVMPNEAQRREIKDYIGRIGVKAGLAPLTMSDVECRVMVRPLYAGQDG